MPELKKILIANRGEIAIRVMQTAKRLNIKTVAVYSDVDRHADHVAFADEAYALGGTTSAESYLQIPKIMEAIKETGADAVHPGYGFLSENAEFSKTLKDNNIEFIGPNEHAINSMGDKIESMRIAEQAGVKYTVGTEDDRMGDTGYSETTIAKVKQKIDSELEAMGMDATELASQSTPDTPDMQEEQPMDKSEPTGLMARRM